MWHAGHLETFVRLILYLDKSSSTTREPRKPREPRELLQPLQLIQDPIKDWESRSSLCLHHPPNSFACTTRIPMPCRLCLLTCIASQFPPHSSIGNDHPFILYHRMQFMFVELSISAMIPRKFKVYQRRTPQLGYPLTCPINVKWRHVGLSSNMRNQLS